MPACPCMSHPLAYRHEFSSTQHDRIQSDVLLLRTIIQSSDNTSMCVCISLRKCICDAHKSRTAILLQYMSSICMRCAQRHSSSTCNHSELAASTPGTSVRWCRSLVTPQPLCTWCRGRRYHSRSSRPLCRVVCVSEGQATRRCTPCQF